MSLRTTYYARFVDALDLEGFIGFVEFPITTLEHEQPAP